MSRTKTRSWWAAALFAALLAAGGAAYDWTGGESEAPSYRFAKAERGPISSIVSASGTLRAVVTVEVGSQISGQIDRLLADFNSVVRAGDMIARLDPAQFQANVRQAEAELAVAKANVSMQRATLSELEAEIEGARAALSQVREDMKRKRSLFARKVVSASEVDKAVAANDQAAAGVKAAKAKARKQAAQIEHALAQVSQKIAALSQRRIDLDRTIIRSPVDGVVISRDVDIGQTVAASLQAPVLFTIAQDLHSMQVEVSVDEADIGQIAVAQRAAFTVDSFPNRKFRGRVIQIRKAPVEVSDVVTYTVVVSADNPDLKLLPGMTANVSVITGERKNALRVPSGALRFRPAGTEKSATDTGGRPAAGRRASSERRLKELSEELGLGEAQREKVRAIFAETGRKIAGLRQQGMAIEEIRPLIREMRRRSRPRIEALLDPAQLKKFRASVAARGNAPIQRGRVWLLGADGTPKPVTVFHGISDGTLSEIVRGDIADGQQVIVGIDRKPVGKSRRSLRFGF